MCSSRAHALLKLQYSTVQAYLVQLTCDMSQHVTAKAETAETAQPGKFCFALGTLL